MKYLYSSDLVPKVHNVIKIVCAFPVWIKKFQLLGPGYQYESVHW